MRKVIYLSLLIFSFFHIDWNIAILKYSKYLLPLFALFYFILFFLSGFVKIYKKESPIFLLIFILCFPVVYGVITFNISSTYFIKDAFLIVFPIISSYAFVKILISSNLNFLINIFPYCMFISYTVFSILTYPSPRNTFLFFRESTLSFTFGFFALYFLIKKCKKSFLFYILATIITFKRISILAIITSIIPNFLIIKNKYNKYRLNIIFLSLILLIFLFIFATMKDMFLFLETKYHIITSGRVWIYDMIKTYLFSKPFIGYGLGYVYNILDNLIGNLHSDILKLTIEIGIVGITFQYLLYLFYSFKYRYFKSLKYFITFIIYITIIYLTDNALIYTTYIFPALSLVIFEIEKEILGKRCDNLK